MSEQIGELRLTDETANTGAFKFDEDQQAAIAAGCDVKQRLVAITGPAGTGKTKLIEEIYKKLTAAGYVGRITAPTGKAAKRVGESTGFEALTNHRLLGYGMPIEVTRENEETGEKTITEVSTGPRYNRSNPLPDDFIIGDEYAMVNETIHAEITAALKSGARLIMLGDANQLKPIETGPGKKDEATYLSPFQRALKNFNGIHLRTIHRQSEGSGIAKNCAKILEGSVPRSEPDFQVVFSDKPTEKLTEMFFDLQEQGIDFTQTDCQIITPMNISWVGVEKLNAMIHGLVFDRSQPWIELPRHNKRDWKTGKVEVITPIRVQIGSKVIYTANTYDLNDENRSSVFNGEVGKVVAFDSSDGTIDIDFGDRILTIPPVIVSVRDDGRATETDPRKNIALAYAVTTHKMQGSECRVVCYVLNKSTQRMQNRANFYTACSRARKMCYVLTDQLSIRKSATFKG